MKYNEFIILIDAPFDTIPREKERERESISVSDTLIMWVVSCYNIVTRSASYNIYRLLSYKTRYSNFIQNKEDQHKFFKHENKSSSNLIIILGCYEILFLLNWTSAPATNKSSDKFN